MEKFKKFILSLEEYMTIGKFEIKKKYVMAALITLGAYILLNVYNAHNNQFSQMNRNGDEAFEQIMKENEQKVENAVNGKDGYVPKDFTAEKNFKSQLERMKNLSDDEIREIFKAQNMEISDADIRAFREEMSKMNMSDEAQKQKMEELRKALEQAGTFGEMQNNADMRNDNTSENE